MLKLQADLAQREEAVHADSQKIDDLEARLRLAKDAVVDSDDSRRSERVVWDAERVQLHQQVSGLQKDLAATVPKYPNCIQCSSAEPGKVDQGDNNFYCWRCWYVQDQNRIQSLQTEKQATVSRQTDLHNTLTSLQQAQGTVLAANDRLLDRNKTLEGQLGDQAKKLDMLERQLATLRRLYSEQRTKLQQQVAVVDNEDDDVATSPCTTHVSQLDREGHPAFAAPAPRRRGAWPMQPSNPAPAAAWGPPPAAAARGRPRGAGWGLPSNAARGRGW